MSETRFETSADLQASRQQLLRIVLRAAVGFGLVALVAGLSQIKYPFAVPLYIGSYLGVVVVTLWPRAPYVYQALAVLILMYALGLLGLIEDGLSGDGRIFMLALPFLTVVFFGRWEGVGALVLSVVTLAAMGLIYGLGILAVPEEKYIYSANPLAWISGTMVFLLIGVLTLSAQSYLLRWLVSALGKSQGLLRQLDETQGDLRERAEGLESAHRLLEKRTRAVEATSDIAREAVAILEVDVLVDRMVVLIGDRFKYYHVGIFMLDPAHEWAELVATSSRAGRHLMERGFRLRVGQEGIVGHVSQAGEAYLAADVKTDALYLPDASLPGVQSEAALPLQARGEIVGVLDVQSQPGHDLGPEDVSVLQTLAEQVALAISNARLFQQVQKSVAAERQVYARSTRHAWQDLARAQAGRVKRFDPQGVLAGIAHGQESAQVALSTGLALQSQDEKITTLSVPIRVREQVIGVVSVHKPAGTGEWTPEETALLSTLTEQLGVAAESARLYQDTQQRAARDRLLGDISTRVRETLNVELVLKAAAREISQALDLAALDVRLGKPGEQPGGEAVDIAMKEAQ